MTRRMAARSKGWLTEKERRLDAVPFFLPEQRLQPARKRDFFTLLYKEMML